MEKPDNPYLQPSLAVIWAYLFVVCIPNLTVCIPIDEEILNGASDLNSLDLFFLNSNDTIELKIELDMMLTFDQYKSLYEPDATKREESKERTGISSTSSKWPQGYVPYEIEDSIRWASRTIKSAIAHWEMNTCLIFNETKLTYFGVRFTSGTSCSSYVGNMWRIQPLILSSGCVSKATIIHEIGHAIGFLHEQNRPDRDSYIMINLETVPAVFHTDYTKLSVMNNFGVPYDYTSIMHYRKLGIITTRDPAYQDKIGRSPGLSFKDIKHANLMYDCQNVRERCLTKSCPFNGFVFFKAFKGKPACECFCDSGDVEDPLVPCSSIDKEVPGYNLAAAGSIESAGSYQCQDDVTSCEQEKAQGKCLTEAAIMNERCPKTCSFCRKSEGPCIDHADGCERFIDMCNTTLISKQCAQSCAVCVAPLTPCGLEQSLNVKMENEASVKCNFINMFVMLQLIVTFSL